MATPLAETILITGASGFLGGALAERLRGTAPRICLLGRSRSDFGALGTGFDVLRADTPDEIVATVNSIAPTMVYNCAGRVLTDHRPCDVGDLIGSNVAFFAALLDGLSRSVPVIRMVNVGTYLEHGPDGRVAPNSLYAATKQACYPIADFYSSRVPLRMMTVKPSVMYGPSEKRWRLINLLVAAARDGRELNMSPGAQRINVLHGDDAVNALLAAARLCLGEDTGLCGEYFALSDDTLTVRELAATVERIAGRSLKINWDAVPYKETEVMYPYVDGPRVPGWRAEIDLASGISDLL